jgi:hypothetical protein
MARRLSPYSVSIYLLIYLSVQQFVTITQMPGIVVLRPAPGKASPARFAMGKAV